MPQKKKIASRVFKGMTLILLLNTAVIATLLLSYISGFLSPAKYPYLTYFSLAYPAILVLNITFVVFWITKQRWLFLISLIAIAAGWNHVEAHFRLFPDNDLDSSRKSLKVMTYNVMFFDRFCRIQPDNVATLNEICSTIASESPDILCIQEFYSDNTPDFNTLKIFSARLNYPYHYINPLLVKRGTQTYGMALFSKHPILGSGNISFSGSPYYSATYSDVKVGIDTFRVINAHLESLRLSNEDRIFINEFATQDNTLSAQTPMKILRKLRKASTLRAAQAEALQKSIVESPHAVILCADLNDIPLSYAYRKINSRLKDAFVQSGQGFGNTYHGLDPSFRIDYVFSDPIFDSKSYKVIRKKLSDHFPVITTLQYK